MCPLRLILIFLSATLAGFFVLRKLNSKPVFEAGDCDSLDAEFESSISQSPPVKSTSKVYATITTAFWTCVDMASGRYLWRNLVSSSSSSAKLDD